MCLYEELDVALEVAVVVVVVVVVSDGAEAVGEDPHLHGAVGAAREDVVGGPHFDLHDAGAQVPEERLASVLVGEGVERTLRGHAPDLQSRKADDGNGYGGVQQEVAIWHLQSRLKSRFKTAFTRSSKFRISLTKKKKRKKRQIPVITFCYM